MAVHSMLQCWAIVTSSGRGRFDMIFPRRTQAINKAEAVLKYNWAHLYREGWRCQRITIVRDWHEFLITMNDPEKDNGSD